MNILSIQSHVAFGRVGNRAAILPLELLGFDVMPVNTVQFSNHPGYGSWHGTVFSGDHIRDIIAGLDEIGALRKTDAILSGYIGNAETGKAILEAVDRVREMNPQTVYLLDPVMGDSGKGFFVKPDVHDFIKNEALPRATIVKPNCFEAEFLSGIQIKTLADAREAARLIRARGPSVVLITSVPTPDNSNKIGMLLSTATDNWFIATDKIALSPEPNGGGDLTAALFLGRYLSAHNPNTALSDRIVLEQTANSVHAVYEKTKGSGTRELDLVAARHSIVSPTMRFQAERS